MSFKSAHGLRKYDHVSELHTSQGWLSIDMLVCMRAFSVLFNTLKYNWRQYVHQWLVKYESDRDLRSNNKYLLVCTRVKSFSGSRAFSISGPSSLTLVRESSSLEQLQSRLISFLSSQLILTVFFLLVICLLACWCVLSPWSGKAGIWCGTK